MAPKKKKKSGKKGKLAKMTEEERILYMEQKALAEEEMRKKKEDMLNQFLKVCWTHNYGDNKLNDVILNCCLILPGRRERLN